MVSASSYISHVQQFGDGFEARTMAKECIQTRRKFMWELADWMSTADAELEPVVKRAVGIASAVLQELELLCPIIYEIHKEGEVRGYLIGTLHRVNKAVVQHRAFYDVIEKSTGVFFEIFQPEDEIPYIPFPPIYDTYATGTGSEDFEDSLSSPVIKEGVKVVGNVECGKFVIEVTKGLTDASFQNVDPTGAQFLQKYGSALEHIRLEAFIKGQVGMLSQLEETIIPHEVEKVLIGERNRGWLNGDSGGINLCGGILGILQRSSPHSFFVGYVHLLGEYGLIKMLESEGYTLCRVVDV